MLSVEEYTNKHKHTQCGVHMGLVRLRLFMVLFMS